VQALLAGQTAQELSATRGDMYIFCIAKNPRPCCIGGVCQVNDEDEFLPWLKKDPASGLLDYAFYPRPHLPVGKSEAV
jgi:hypothetical protein